jgi:hypothetical protein
VGRVQGAHRAEGRGRGARERAGAERDRARAQLGAGAVEGDERGQARSRQAIAPREKLR